MLMQRITIIRLWIIININEIMPFGKRYQKIRISEPILLHVNAQPIMEFSLWTT